MRLIEHLQEDEFQAWRLTLGLPEPQLARYIVQFWEVRGRFAHTREHILPMGDMALIVNLGAPQRLLDRTEPGARAFDDAWISGLQSGHLITESPDGTWLCGVRLTPEGAFRLRLGAAELSDRVVELGEAMGGPEARGFADRLRSEPDPRRRLARLQELVVRRLGEGRDWDAAIVWAAETLRRSSGGAPIGWIAGEIGWSRQRLHQRFQDAAGLAPKVFARILRFQEVVRRIGEDRAVDLAGLALAAGYYDQAHFNRDFKAFSGLTPTEYLRDRVEGADLGFARRD